MPSESLDKDRLSAFPESEASLIAKQARSEYLDRVAVYCELERGDPEEQKRVMGMQRPLYHNPGKATNNLTLLWHNVANEKADLDLKIVNGHINKCMKLSRPAKPWGYHDFFTGSGYPTHNLEGLDPYPESLALPTKPPPTEPTAEDQPFCKVHKHPDDPRERINVTSGSFSLSAYQLKEQEAVARKTAAAFSNTLSIAEYVYNQPVLDNLSKTIPPIDRDQRMALLHAPFKGTTLFGGELAKVYRANKERACSVIVFPTATPQSYTSNLTYAVVDPSGKVAPPTGEVASIGIRVDPPLRPQLPVHPGLEMGSPP